LAHADHTLLAAAMDEKNETSALANSAFDLIQLELAKFSWSTPESQLRLSAFRDACSKDEAAVSRLAKLKKKVTPVVSVCHFAISVVLT
jgi:hypothetical protein